ncbi:hypothetical protein LguiA_003726 [Lonicera macranthoides]
MRLLELRLCCGDVLSGVHGGVVAVELKLMDELKCMRKIVEEKMLGEEAYCCNSPFKSDANETMIEKDNTISENAIQMRRDRKKLRFAEEAQIRGRSSDSRMKPIRALILLHIMSNEFWFEVFGEDSRVVASGQSLMHPLNEPINKHVLFIAKYNSNKPQMDNELHKPVHFEWVTNADGSLHGHEPLGVLNISAARPPVMGEARKALSKYHMKSRALESLGIWSKGCFRLTNDGVRASELFQRAPELSLVNYRVRTCAGSMSD